MSATLQADGQHATGRELLQHAVDLLSQQLWCWGRDILRPEGNWLLEIGFERIEAPADRERCSSVYTLEMPQERRVLLRGFGVFYGDDQRGGVFLPRYEFQPRYSTRPKLECPPWTLADMPELSAPNEPQRNACTSLTRDLIDWIHSYEATVAERLGLDYRQSTLLSWENNKRPILPAEQIAPAWKSLKVAVSENTRVFIP